MQKLLVYELNEVSWRVVDYYLANRPSSNLATVLTTAAQFTTYTTDSGELHPWSTWPTMHRGVNNDVHEIRFINQDLTCAQDYPTVWQILSKAKRTVGICGCLQSYPPLQDENVLFHIPDTFAPAEDSLPSRYTPFQKINLKLTAENKAVATAIGLDDLQTGLGLFNAGVSLKTGARLAQHLLKERLNSLNKSLRATMQAHVAFDVFMDALKETKPDYAAVFTNHVAGTMHRYWKYAFPEDFEYELTDSKFDQFHSQSVLKAMDIFDAQLGVLQRFAEKNGYDLVISSSMGQEAVHRGAYSPELRLDNAELLAQKMGFADAFKMNLAMQPDVNFVFEDISELTRFKQALGRFVDSDGKPVLRVRYEEQGLSLNLMTCRSWPAFKERALFIDGERHSLEELGFASFMRDPGTGYHQPEGILIWSSPSMNSPIRDRQRVDSRRYAPTILHFLGAPIPEHMMAPLVMTISPDSATRPVEQEEASIA